MIYMILLLMAVSSDSDIYMLEKGASLKELQLKKVLFHSMIFAGIATIMAWLGLSIGQLILDSNLIIIHEILTIIVMFIISAFLFVRTFNKKKFVEHRDEFEIKSSIKQAIYTGIDTLLIGIGLSSMGFSFSFILFVVFVVNISSSISAVCLGYYIGEKFQKLFGYSNALVYFILANVELVLLFF